MRESPAIDVVRLLVGKGARVVSFEPNSPGQAVSGAQAAPSLEAALERAEAVALLVDHREFRELDPARVAAAMPGRRALDTRGIWERAQWKEIGFRLFALGSGEV
jgi:UDPglucose 6-dehydrogenase